MHVPSQWRDDFPPEIQAVLDEIAGCQRPADHHDGCQCAEAQLAELVIAARKTAADARRAALEQAAQWCEVFAERQRVRLYLGELTSDDKVSAVGSMLGALAARIRSLAERAP